MTEYEIQFTTEETLPGALDQDTDQSSSTLNDCPSNDEDCLDNDPPEPNDADGNPDPLERLDCASGKVGTDLEYQKIMDSPRVPSGVEAPEGSPWQLETSGPGTLCQRLLTEYGDDLLWSRPTYTDSNPFAMVDTSDCVTVENDKFGPGRVCSAAVSIQQHGEVPQMQYDIFEPCQNNVSNSTLNWSRKAEEFNFFGEGDVVGLIGFECSEERRSPEQLPPRNYSLGGDTGGHYDEGRPQKSRRVVPLRSVNHYLASSLVARDVATQTKERARTERCSSTNDNLWMVDSLLGWPRAEELIHRVSVDLALDLLRAHVDAAIKGAAIKGAATSDRSRQRVSEGVLEGLHASIREMCALLDSRTFSDPRARPAPSHQRCFSEGVGQAGDLLARLELESSLASGHRHIRQQVPQPPEEEMSSGEACRTFELNPYDDLVRSSRSANDRRIKAVGTKMKCRVLVSGPLRIFDSTAGCWNVRNKTAFRCAIRGPSKEAVDKCLKCLQDTFPQSCLNEKTRS